MKKILSLAVALLTSLCINAQVSVADAKTSNLLKTNPVKVMSTMTSNRFDKATNRPGKAIMKAPSLGANERIIGLYDTDDYSENGLGLTGAPGTYTVLTNIPASKYSKLSGASINRLRFALAEKCSVKEVVVWELRTDGYVYEVMSQPISSVNVGWNEVTLDKPYAIDPAMPGILLGFTYEQTSTAYPLSVMDVKATSELSFALFGDLGEGNNIYDFSSYGALSVQGIATCEAIPAVDIVLENFDMSTSIATAGQEIGYGFNVYNYGTETINSYEIDVTLDGNIIEKVTSPAITNQKQDHVQYYTLPLDLPRGSHTLAVEVVNVNGAKPTVGTEDDKLSLTFTSFMESDAVKRQKHLVEEFTSHSCTYCPYGANVMEAILKKRDDVAIACIHGNQSSKDPFNNSQCDAIMSYIGVNSFPSATFNRIFIGGEDGVVPGIGYDPSYASQVADEFLNIMDTYSVPAFASVDITKELNGNDLTIKVNGKGGEVANELLKDYSLTVYIIEDSLKYRQLNLGKWVNNYIHNHVLRQVVTATNGDQINWTSSSSYENVYNVTLDGSWDQNHLAVIAFISKKQPLKNADITNLDVSNANILHFTEHSTGGNGGNDTPDTPVTDANVKLSPMADASQIMGEAMSGNTTYVVGTNYATFAPVIWNTETSAITDFPQYNEGAFHAVSANGLAVGDNGNYAIAARPDGTEIKLFYEVGETKHNDEYDFDYSTGDAGSSAWTVSADEKVIAGCFYDSNYKTTPCIWNEKGERSILPIPDDINIDGAQVRWMTPDASILLGFANDNFSTWPAVLWRKNAQGGYDCDFIGKNFWEPGYKQGKPYMVFLPNGISENGEWVSLAVQPEYDDWDFSVEIPAVQVARLNLNTNALELLTTDVMSVMSTGIANDGSTLLYSGSSDMFGRQGYIWKAGATSVTSIDAILSSAKGVPALGANTPCAITADGMHIQGFAISQDADIFSYVLSLDEKANGIDNVTVGNTIRPAATDRIYNIAGQQLRNANDRGLYIVNGKKFVK